MRKTNYGRYTESGQAIGPFAMFLQEHGIVAQYTMHGSPDQNVVAERTHRTLMNIRVVDSISRPLKMYCDNSDAAFMAKNKKMEVEVNTSTSDT
jgi:hypothetical protein